jgi:hypothetical protein
MNEVAFTIYQKEIMNSYLIDNNEKNLYIIFNSNVSDFVRKSTK